MAKKKNIDITTKMTVDQLKRLKDLVEQVIDEENEKEKRKNEKKGDEDIVFDFQYKFKP